MTSHIGISSEYQAAVASTRDLLARCGTWWAAKEIASVVARADARAAARSTPPWIHELPPAVELPEAALSVIDRIATDPASVDAEWAAEHVRHLGDGAYVELVGVTAVAVALRIFADAVGTDVEPLPAPADAGTPSGERPDGVRAIGAYVPMVDPFPFANVARALSLVPSANELFYTLVRPMYSAAGFESLVWDTPLSRPQVELVASRVAALNECFY